MRVIFMGTPAFAVPTLSTLIAAGHDVCAVYSQPPRPAGRGMKLTASPVQQLAEEKGIPVFTPTSLKSAEEQARFAELGADLAVVAAYGLLLPQAVLDAPRLGCINIHPSDLPRWRGAAPLQRTLMAGDKTTACCIMQMDAGLDTGDVLIREQHPVLAGTSFGQLQEAMALRGAALTLVAIDQLQAASATRTQQHGEPTYAAKLTKADQWLDFAQPAPVLLRQLLALTPAPAALAMLGDEPLKIFAAALEPGDAGRETGRTLDDALLVNCGEGTALRLNELQRPNKGRQPAAAFLQGRPVPAGSQFTLPKV
jgi:methionyl-tRNA formyltransferase